ncbi:MAG: YajQ family cyclic di-GMP-binding protein [Acidimicrobiia bacterium]
MPSFDVVSEVDQQEVKNAIDQAQRELANRFDFKGTDSSIELEGLVIKLASVSEDRIKAVKLLVEEKLVKRGVSLKGVEWGKVEDAAGGRSRQSATLQAGISTDRAKQINKAIKESGLKGLSSQTQGDQVRVTGKKRDDLQAAIALLKEGDYGIPLQFNNFRD